MAQLIPEGWGSKPATGAIFTTVEKIKVNKVTGNGAFKKSIMNV